MFIIPLARNLSCATFPFITTALLLVNVLVFFALQAPDATVVKNFADAYVKSGLAREELPVYTTWLSSKRNHTPAPTVGNRPDIGRHCAHYVKHVVKGGATS